jgi:hypothetical protein
VDGGGEEEVLQHFASDSGAAFLFGSSSDSALGELESPGQGRYTPAVVTARSRPYSCIILARRRPRALRAL